MPRQALLIGTTANDGTGDTLRAAGDKINDNYEELYARIPSILFYGAVADGSTADNTAFNAALAASDVVIIPRGTTIALNAAAYTGNATIVGECRFSSKIKWLNATGTDDLFDWSGLANVEFRNLTIDCNRQGHTDTSGYFAAIWFACSNGSTLRVLNTTFVNGRIIDVRVNGPTATGESVSFDLKGCAFEDGFVGTASRAAQCVSLADGVTSVIIGNRFSLPTRPTTYGRAGVVHDGVNRNGTDARGTMLATGNKFVNIGRGTDDTLGCLDVYYGADDIIMSGNQGEGVCGRFCTVKGDMSRAVISNNVCDDVFSSVANTAVGYGLWQDLYGAGTDADKYLVISDNVIGSSDAYGVFIDGDEAGGTDFSNVVVSNNLIGACDKSGMEIRNISSVSLNGNFIDGGVDGISLTEITGDLTIAGGRIANQSQHGIVSYGTMSSARVIVQGTRIRNVTARAITLAACESYDINVDVHTAAQGLNTSGSTGHSRVRGKFVSVTIPWTRSGTDTLVDWRVESESSALNFSVRELTIASGEITVLADWHWVDTEADAASDDLVTVNGGWDGRVVTLRPSSNTRDVVMKDATGNLQLNGDFTMTHSGDNITLQYASGTWYELSRSDNAA